MPYVYVLISDRTVKAYTGYTNDLVRRLEEHNSPNNQGWTSGFQPWQLDAFVEVDNKHTGLIVEAYFKSSSGKEKLKNFALVNPNHPHPRQGFFDSLVVQEGRGFGRRENRFKVTVVDDRPIFVMANL